MTCACPAFWLTQGVTGAEVVTGGQFRELAPESLDNDFDWPVPVAFQCGVALYLRPRTAS